MKKSLIPVFAALLFAAGFPVNNAIAQVKGYETITEQDGTLILKGMLQRSDIEQNPKFAWFGANMKVGKANAAAVTAFQKNKDKFQLIVFAGTWCEDTHNLLPSFYRLVDQGGIADKNITLVGVDREKTALYNLHTLFNVTMTPTFIVMKDGKEIGRVSEYGKYGLIDKELGEIVNTIQ